MYETDGANPIGVHEPSEIRLLTPIVRPTSVRLCDVDDDGQIDFDYTNPSTFFGPGDQIPRPGFARRIVLAPCLGIVIGGSGLNVDVSDADDLVLGLTLVSFFVAPDDSKGRMIDAGFSIGPAITTPDELDDSVTEHKEGRRYRFAIAARVGSDEVGRYELGSAKKTIAQVLSYLSESSPMRQGDLVCIKLGLSDRTVDKGDDMHVSSEKLGTLSSRFI